MKRKWKSVAEYVSATGEVRYVAECTRCKDTKGFKNPDEMKRSCHNKEDCDEVLKTAIIFNIMQE